MIEWKAPQLILSIHDNLNIKYVCPNVKWSPQNEVLAPREETMIKIIGKVRSSSWCLWHISDDVSATLHLKALTHSS